MRTMTIIDPETGEILTGEISTPTEEALKAGKRYYQKMKKKNNPSLKNQN